MAKLNTNSNVYTIVYAIVLVLIVAFLLVFVASSLKPLQDANVEIDKKSQILAALNIRDIEKADVEARYDAVIVSDMTNDKELYTAKIEGKSYYVVPVKGAGLWGGLSGYVALEADCETIFGTYFDHESETAGLGARLTEAWFQESFIGKKIYAVDNADEIAIAVYKKGKEIGSADNYVNGITGATLTSNGVHDMLRNCLNDYKDTLKQLN